MILLADGRVFVVGGNNSNGRLANSAIYDPTTISWTATAPMNTARANPMVFLLNDGRVMVAGGTGVNTTLQSSEIYDPATNTWSSGPQLTEPRESPIVSLANGDILAIDGGSGGTLLASAEVYSNSITKRQYHLFSKLIPVARDIRNKRDTESKRKDQWYRQLHPADFRAQRHWNSRENSHTNHRRFRKPCVRHPDRSS
jgi:hypothetical protein